MTKVWLDLQQVDRVVHEPARLMLLGILSGAEEADFSFLAHETGLTKGNLSSHLTKLEESGYIRVTKSFQGKMPLTVAALTPAGRRALMEYRKTMRKALG